MYNPLLKPCCLQSPERLTGVPSWIEHIPFAFALMDVLRPRLFVELGTHKGDSYCAFCQAVQHLGLPTRCFAVDKWTGDDHSGAYDPSVLNDLQQYHNPRYGQFSTLVQMEFDTARPHFADGSIDLLHIDGYHTYEAVKHDYETWLPTLSSRGVVLFHDTQVRDRDFGVWKLWEEVRQGGRQLEFLHGNGLGVLAVGSELPPEAVDFFETAQRHPSLLEFFASLGRQVAQSGTVRLQAEEIIRRHQEIGLLHQEVAAHQAAQAHARVKGAEREIELAVLDGKLKRRTAEVGRLSEQLADAERRQQQRQREIELMDQQIQRLEESVDEARRQVEQLYQHITDMRHYYHQGRFQMAEWLNLQARKLGRLRPRIRSAERQSATPPPPIHAAPAAPHFVRGAGVEASRRSSESA